MRLYELFDNMDATQVEINPFAETVDGKGTRGKSLPVCCTLSLVQCIVWMQSSTSTTAPPTDKSASLHWTRRAVEMSVKQ